jgi:uncharacterized protein YecE (DUF72 family)
MDLIRIGTSSFSEKDWVGPFYPEGTKPSDFISYYATKFDTVEVDSTYYAVPGERTIENWVEKTPESFLISAKFPRSIVHGGQGAVPDRDVLLNPNVTYGERDRFLEVMRGLGNRLGSLVLQFPYFNKKVFGSKTQFFDLLERFLEDLPGGYRYAVEIRNRYWLTEEYAVMLRKYKVGMVLVDQAWMPHGDEVTKLFDPVTADFVYIRLLGDRKEIEALTQTWDQVVIDRDDRLKRWAELIHSLAKRDLVTLTYSNNHYAGYAPATAYRLQEFLQEIDARYSNG